MNKHTLYRPFLETHKGVSDIVQFTAKVMQDSSHSAIIEEAKRRRVRFVITMLAVETALIEGKSSCSTSILVSMGNLARENITHSSSSYPHGSSRSGSNSPRCSRWGSLTRQQ